MVGIKKISTQKSHPPKCPGQQKKYFCRVSINFFAAAAVVVVVAVVTRHKRSRKKGRRSHCYHRLYCCASFERVRPRAVAVKGHSTVESAASSSGEGRKKSWERQNVCHVDGEQFVLEFLSIFLLKAFVMRH